MFVIILPFIVLSPSFWSIQQTNLQYWKEYLNWTKLSVCRTDFFLIKLKSCIATPSLCWVPVHVVNFLGSHGIKHCQLRDLLFWTLECHCAVSNKPRLAQVAIIRAHICVLRVFDAVCVVIAVREKRERDKKHIGFDLPFPNSEI